MKNIIVLANILILLVSCRNYSPELEESLVIAGTNRPELEKVLDYYRFKGKVAYQSACFLVENMRYHKSKQVVAVDGAYHTFFRQTDSIYNVIFGNMTLEEIKSYRGREYDSLRTVLKQMFSELPIPKKDKEKPLPDLQTISSEFLIDNIDQALRVWKANNYSYKKDFNFFKEFILPYRVTDEYPDIKRSTLSSMFGRILTDSVDNSIYTKMEQYKEYVRKCRWINYHVKVKDHLGIYDLFIPKFQMDCHNMTNWSCNIFRSSGIPTVYEFTPLWKERDSKHFWCVSPDSVGVLQPYTAPDNNLREDWESDIQYAGKVYRRTFGAQKDTPYFLANEDEYIPELFRIPLLLDQTSRYHPTTTLRLPLDEDISNNLVYLCMFSTTGLSPVAWGKIDHKKREAVFEQVPLNTLFFPVCYDEAVMLNIAEPFMIHANQAQETQHITLACDTNKRVNLHLLRKYPEKRRMKSLHEKLKGAVLLGSNHGRKYYDTLLVLKDVPKPYLQEVAFENEKKYRYYRFNTPENSPVNISHMEFLTPHAQGRSTAKPTSLPVFSAEDKIKSAATRENFYRINGIPIKTGRYAETAFDNNPKTYLAAASLGMDFETPVQISRIRFLPRTANNMIVPGNSYLLLYYDKGWKEFATIRAEDDYLDFNNVPAATLFWLRNLTEGKEELPFFYINDRQYFLHTDTLPDDFNIRK